MKHTTILLFTTLLCLPTTVLADSAQEACSPCATVQLALADYHAIRPGVTRRDVEKNFKEDGGLQFRDKGRYTYKGCEYIKIEITFEAAPSGGGVRPTSPGDVVQGVSQLFIDYPVKD